MIAANRTAEGNRCDITNTSVNGCSEMNKLQRHIDEMIIQRDELIIKQLIAKETPFIVNLELHQDISIPEIPAGI